MKYNPDKAPDPEKWLELDEQERIDLALAWHRRKHIQIPIFQAHALVHVIVETQLAENIPEVVEALARLKGEGLSRHDAIHAIGFVFVGVMGDLKRAGADPVADLEIPYLEEVSQLTAEKWWDMAEDPD